MSVIKKNILVTTEEYTIILDALEMMESKIASKITKAINPKKRAKLKTYNITIQELITDLVDDEQPVMIA